MQKLLKGEVNYKDVKEEISYYNWSHMVKLGYLKQTEKGFILAKELPKEKQLKLEIAISNYKERYPNKVRNKGVSKEDIEEWLEMIFNEEKGLEFRKKIISTIKPETKIYFYETKKKNGTGKVVGDAIITKVDMLDQTKHDLYLQCWSYIGYLNQRYMICFTAVNKYDHPLELTDFEYNNGKTLIHPPQNMVNVRRKLK